MTTTDPDVGDTFTYSIVGGTDAVNFAIGGLGADELLLDDGVLDLEAQPSYGVIAQVTDSGGLTHDEPMTVTWAMLP